MNNVFKITLAAALIMSAASTAQAESKGTITFTGLIINDTCDIKIGDKDDVNYEVAFPATHPEHYGSPGAVGVQKDFTMELTNCEPGTLTGVSAAFKGSSGTTDNTFEVLKLDSGTAKNVGIRLYSNHKGTEIPVKLDGSRPADADFAAFTDAGNGTKSASLKYTAKVVQVGDKLPEAGDYTASATYELVYN